MMVEREDLGLSLSVSAFSHHNTNHHPKNDNTIQLSLMPSLFPTSSSSPHSVFNPQKPSWFNAALPSSDRNSDTCRTPAKSHLRGIDVNRPPSSGDCDDVSSPNSTVSSVSGKQSERDTILLENQTIINNEIRYKIYSGSPEYRSYVHFNVRKSQSTIIRVSLHPQSRISLNLYYI